MAVRIRKDGRVLCAAMHVAEEGDRYIDDGLHYLLSVELGVLVTDSFHLHEDPEAHEGDTELTRADMLDGHGEWWWVHETPPDFEGEWLPGSYAFTLLLASANAREFANAFDYWVEQVAEGKPNVKAIQAARSVLDKARADLGFALGEQDA